ncbi:S1 RNA-binding domain-containing protein [Streptococcus pneumoniae]|nr:S1 RNA-binding domain-containing protein [Streptococcus pneumoniae]
MCFTHSFFHFATLRKSLQAMSVFALPYVWLLALSVSSTTSKHCFELTRQFIYNLKQCFEQPAASFLVCSLIFIEY